FFLIEIILLAVYLLNKGPRKRPITLRKAIVQPSGSGAAEEVDIKFIDTSSQYGNGRFQTSEEKKTFFGTTKKDRLKEQAKKTQERKQKKETEPKEDAPEENAEKEEEVTEQKSVLRKRLEKERLRKENKNSKCKNRTQINSFLFGEHIFEEALMILSDWEKNKFFCTDVNIVYGHVMLFSIGLCCLNNSINVFFHSQYSK
ncbi:60S ribosomal protein L3, partial [Reticulomyxa filosa]